MTRSWLISETPACVATFGVHTTTVQVYIGSDRPTLVIYIRYVSTVVARIYVSGGRPLGVAEFPSKGRSGDARATPCASCTASVRPTQLSTCAASRAHAAPYFQLLGALTLIAPHAMHFKTLAEGDSMGKAQGIRMEKMQLLGKLHLRGRLENREVERGGYSGGS